MPIWLKGRPCTQIWVHVSGLHDVTVTFQRHIKSPVLNIYESDRLMLPGVLSTAGNGQGHVSVWLTGTSPEHRGLSGCWLGSSSPHTGYWVGLREQDGCTVACWAGAHGPGLLWGEDPGRLPPSEPLWSANQEGSDKPDFPTAGVGPAFFSSS